MPLGRAHFSPANDLGPLIGPASHYYFGIMYHSTAYTYASGKVHFTPLGDSGN